MTKIAYDIWEPMVAPWVYKLATLEAFEALMGIMSAICLLFAVAFRLGGIVPEKEKKPWMNRVATILVAALAADFLTSFLFLCKTMDYRLYIKGYGECEQMYIEEVVPALDRLNGGDTEIGDLAIFGGYIERVYSEHEVPETRFKNFIDFWVQNDAGDKLVDLCDYNKLANAFNIRELLKAIGNIDSIQFGEHP